MRFLRVFILALTLCPLISQLSVAQEAGPTEAGPTDLSVTKHGDGWHFADAKGLALYTYDKDEASGKSQCKGDCATTWPPYVAADDAKPRGGWDIIVREDGVRQWTYRGKPVYSYSRDQTPETTFGDGFGAAWHVALQPISMPPEAMMGKTFLGIVLTDAKGLTLYSLDDGKSCTGACLAAWMPLAAPWAAVKSGDWNPVEIQDGTKQWSYKGKILFAYAGDAVPGDTIGHGVAKIWHAAILEPALANPAWVTFVNTDGGEILANAAGHTIYTYNYFKPFISGPRMPEKIEKLALLGICEAECRRDEWVPIIADADAKSMGNWTVMDMKNEGMRQWAFKGRPLYTNNHDKVPGEFYGVNFGDNNWRAIMRNGANMQGVSAG